jgi:2-polyprenyl-6-methoxyphenol hydroxylase-like FAD-dependent oxidoreductase
LLRSDLAKVIYDSLGKDTEVIFGDTINNIEQDDEKVVVTFRSGIKRNFDLLIGADGLHSNVRNLVFGEETQFEKYFGYYTSSYTIHNFSVGNNAFSMYNVPYKQVAVYSNKESQTTTFFIFTSPEKLPPSGVEKQKQILKSEFEHSGWKCPELLSEMDSATDFYFDPISQIKIEKWSEGRISLVGDACYCPSLLSGKGSTLAMVGAYILAGELKEANGNYQEAFKQYQILFKPFMDKKQKAARFFAKSFIPKSNFGIWVRNTVFKLMSVSLFSKLFLNQFKDSELKLKEY